MKAAWRIRSEMKRDPCPHCGRNRSTEPHADSCPKAVTDPPHPDGFGGSDEGSHYMSSKEGMKGLGYGTTGIDTERFMEKAGITREEAQDLRDKMVEQFPAVGETLERLAPEDPKAARKAGQVSAFKEAYGDPPQEETLDELRARLVARLDATSWARHEFSEERVAKQVIVVRTDLKMRKGKIAAQAAHAVMKVFLDRVQHPAVTSYGETRAVARPSPGFSDRYDNPGPGVADQSMARGDITIPLNAPMMDWLMGRFTKVCCRVDSEEELLRICDAALKARLSCALIQDAGLTKFDGVPTLTCCAIGPAYPQDLDPVTGHLKLLS